MLADVRAPDSTRATATVAVALLLALAVVAAGSVGAVLVDRAASTAESSSPAPAVALSLSVEGDRLVLAHEGGEVLDARRLRVVVRVDGTALAHQPPVPFFSATGFEPGPTGPFNVAADPGWTAGESAGFAVAGTNDPSLDAGSRVTVSLHRDGTPVATLTATARARR